MAYSTPEGRKRSSENQIPTDAAKKPNASANQTAKNCVPERMRRIVRP